MGEAITSALLTYGPLGVIAVAMSLGYLVPRPFYMRLERENDKLRQALDAERQRGDAGTAAAATANQMIGAFKQVVEEMRDDKRPGLHG